MGRKNIILLTLILLIIGVILFMHSSYFAVKQILVHGNLYLTEADIIEASGVSKGENIFLLPGREIVNRLMNYVRVKGVKLNKEFPDTVDIIINERAGLGLFPLEDSQLVELSADGTVLDFYANGTPLPALPRIVGISPTIRGQQVILTDNLSELLFMLKELYRLQLKMTQVSYTMEDIRVKLKSGTIIYFGHIADVRQNLVSFEKFWSTIDNPEAKFEYINLSYAGKPVYQKW